MAFDAAGVGAGVAGLLPGAGLAVDAIGVAAGAGGLASGVINHTAEPSDFAIGALGFAGAGAHALNESFKFGAKLAKGIPLVGLAIAGYTAASDSIKAYKFYKNCVSGN